jgi:hypothetical protein
MDEGVSDRRGRRTRDDINTETRRHGIRDAGSGLWFRYVHPDRCGVIVSE